MSVLVPFLVPFFVSLFSPFLASFVLARALDIDAPIVTLVPVAPCRHRWKKRHQGQCQAKTESLLHGNLRSRLLSHGEKLLGIDVFLVPADLVAGLFEALPGLVEGPLRVLLYPARRVVTIGCREEQQQAHPSTQEPLSVHTRTRRNVHAAER
jgi:hypothetical protein